MRNKEQNKQYYLKNKEQIHKVAKEWYLKNREKRLEATREWRLKNKEYFQKFI